MHTARRLRLLPLLGLLCLSGAASAVTYTYTGENFTDPAGTRGAYTTAMSVSGQFTVDMPLASNLVVYASDIRAQVTDYSFFSMGCRR